MLNGFKAFVSRGNMINLAIGVIIGAAFTEPASRSSRSTGGSRRPQV